MKKEHIYIGLFGLLFIAMAIMFLFFPRSTFSEVERRELKQFPVYSQDSLTSGAFTRSISEWFSDSEPYRDRFMSMSMQFKDFIALAHGNVSEEVKFVDDAGSGDVFNPGADVTTGAEALADQRNVGDFQGEVADEASHTAKAGIIIVGNPPTARALMNFGGGEKMGTDYARVTNEFKKELGKDVNVYCMVIPTSIEFYCPPKLKENTNRIKSQASTIRYLYSCLDEDVRAVDVHTALGKHYKEDIFLRTDHHWSPLGGFYAAEALAKVAGVPFRPMSEYTPQTVHGFVGTMFGYSKDNAIKESPEDFVYYVPKDSSYTTTVVQMKVDRNFKVTGESGPVKAPYFHKFKDGSSGAYSTFMGGDAFIVKVQTGVKNGRRIVIMKDSYGNAVPSNLFGSFEEVHVIDFRYFPRNIKKYVKDNGITDLVFCNNIFSACSASVVKNYREMLTFKEK